MLETPSLPPFKVRSENKLRDARSVSAINQAVPRLGRVGTALASHQAGPRVELLRSHTQEHRPLPAALNQGAHQSTRKGLKTFFPKVQAWTNKHTNNWHFAGAVAVRKRERVAKCHDCCNLFECHRKTGGIISILASSES